MDSSSEPDEVLTTSSSKENTTKHCAGVGHGSGRLGESRVLKGVRLTGGAAGGRGNVRDTQVGVEFIGSCSELEMQQIKQCYMEEVRCRGEATPFSFLLKFVIHFDFPWDFHG